MNTMFSPNAAKTANTINKGNNEGLTFKKLGLWQNGWNELDSIKLMKIQNIEKIIQLKSPCKTTRAF
jgi:hypothetical protein